MAYYANCPISKAARLSVHLLVANDLGISKFLYLIHTGLLMSPDLHLPLNESLKKRLFVLLSNISGMKVQNIQMFKLLQTLCWKMLLKQWNKHPRQTSFIIIIMQGYNLGCFL
jgi:hypothetical protein